MDPNLAAGTAVALAAAGVAARERLRNRRLRAGALEATAAPRGEPGAEASPPGLRPANAVPASAVPDGAPSDADAGRRAFVAIARRVQAIVHQQLGELRDMEERHGADPAVFADLMRVDHGTALIGRLADSLVVLGGQSPGRQWTDPVPMLGVLRGAMSRIIDYARVDVGATPDVAVVGRAVEPVVHALAELLDNATRYSSPDSRVRLSARPDRDGVLIEVEDLGVGLGRSAAAWAARVLAGGADGPDFGDLGRSPRLGLPVVARLARVNGFEAAVGEGAAGGVRAVLFLPGALVTAPPEPTPPAERSEPASAGGASASTADNGAASSSRLSPAAEHPVGAHGLPQRRRKLSAAAATGPAHHDPESLSPPGPPAGLWLSAFQAGVRGDAPPRKDDEGQ